MLLGVLFLSKSFLFIKDRLVSHLSILQLQDPFFWGGWGRGSITWHRNKGVGVNQGYKPVGNDKTNLILNAKLPDFFNLFSIVFPPFLAQLDFSTIVT